MPIAQEKETRRPRPRWDSGKPRLALTLSGGIHAAALTGFLLYNALPTRPISAVPVFELVSLEQPRLRPVAPKSPEPPSPPEKVETRAPEAPKLTAKPKKMVPSLKREPKAARAEADTSKPVKDVTQESAELTSPTISNIASDRCLGMWAGRLKKKVEVQWNPPAGIEVQGKVKTVVTFQVTRDGSVSVKDVTQISGNATLDHEAVNAILRMGQAIPIPPCFPNEVLQVSYEFVYQGQ